MYRNYTEQSEVATFPYFNAEDVSEAINLPLNKLSSNDTIKTDTGVFISIDDLTMSIPKGNIPHHQILHALGLVAGVIQGITICIATHDTSVKF